jgi:hypothetical protein
MCHQSPCPIERRFPGTGGIVTTLRYRNILGEDGCLLDRGWPSQCSIVVRRKKSVLDSFPLCNRTTEE